MEESKVSGGSSFELELCTDKAKMRRILFMVLVIGILSWTAHLWGSLYWESHSIPARAIRGTEVRFGWAVTLYWWGMIIGIVTPLLLTFLYLLLNKKVPSLALNPDGLFINQQLITKTLVPWNDISRIEKEKQGNTSVLSVYFKNPQQIIEQQAVSKRIFLKEHLRDGEPLTCDNRLITGDFASFFAKTQVYLNRKQT